MATQDQLDKLKALLAQTSTPDADPNSTPAPDATPAPQDIAPNWADIAARLAAAKAGPTAASQAPLIDASNPVADVSGGVPQPNGGMNPAQMAAEIQSNPGPIATTGLNPANPGPIDKFIDASKPIEVADDSDEDDSDDAPVAKKVASAPAPADTTPDADVTSSANVSDLGASGTPAAPAANPSDPFDAQAFKDAQDKGAFQRLMGGLAYGLDPAAHAAYMANTPTTRLLAQQANATAGISHQMAQYQLADEQEKNDPNSAASTLAKSVLQASAKQAGFNVGDVSGMSASSIEKTAPWVAKIIDSKISGDTRAQIAQMRADQMAAQQGNKASIAQDKTLQATKTILESARGNPAARQAETDIYSAQKANSLANLYGDPNKLSQAQVALLASEIGKIAQGGVSSEAELDAITPKTLRGMGSKYVSNLINSPTAANAGAFVKQYQDYANALTTDAQKVIQDKYGRVIESSKKQLGPENYQALQDQYINRFKVGPKATRSPQGSTLANLSPEDQQAVQWAQNNKSDPRSAQILALHGMQ